VSTFSHPDLRDNRILITGGAGFIGSHIADALVTDNDVFILDNFSTGTWENVPAGVEIIEGDIRDDELLRSAMADVDLVFHEAAIVSVDESIDDPMTTHDVTAQATVQLLELAQQESARVVLASSAAIYGQPTDVPIEESASTDPASPYGLAKLTADQYAQLYAELYDVAAIPLRYFNVYGPRQTAGDYSGVISIFFQQARDGGPLTVHGDGSQTRDFIHVDDVVQANLRAAVHDVPGTAYNVGTGQSISIKELAEIIRDLVDLTDSIEITNIEGRDGDIKDSQAAIDRIRAGLEFEPTVSLDEGLRDLASGSQ
jgi:Nucleoside-diphosphate-sugar epimerases